MARLHLSVALMTSSLASEFLVAGAIDNTEILVRAKASEGPTDAIHDDVHDAVEFWNLTKHNYTSAWHVDRQDLQAYREDEIEVAAQARREKEAAERVVQLARDNATTEQIQSNAATEHLVKLEEEYKTIKQRLAEAVKAVDGAKNYSAFIEGTLRIPEASLKSASSAMEMEQQQLTSDETALKNTEDVQSKNLEELNKAEVVATEAKQKHEELAGKVSDLESQYKDSDKVINQTKIALATATAKAGVIEEGLEVLRGHLTELKSALHDADLVVDQREHQTLAAKSENETLWATIEAAKENATSERGQATDASNMVTHIEAEVGNASSTPI